jgi:hypothetical protein
VAAERAAVLEPIAANDRPPYQHVPEHLAAAAATSATTS